MPIDGGIIIEFRTKGAHQLVALEALVVIESLLDDAFSSRISWRWSFDMILPLSMGFYSWQNKTLGREGPFVASVPNGAHCMLNLNTYW